MAWEIIKKGSPPVDIIVSDWNMPNCSGLELLKLVRGDERFSKLPFLMVTAESEGRKVTAALAAGVDGYVVKPFALSGLMDKLELLHKKCLKK